MNSMKFNLPSLSPVEETKRIIYLDVIRGIAILGILLMNIYNFGMVSFLQERSGIYEGTGTLNFNIWFLGNIFIDGKMRGIFSMLFGAGILLFANKVDKGTIGAHYRRMLWLFIFGMADAFILLWKGDILHEYAICGMLLFPLRKLKPIYLVTIAFLIIAFNIYYQSSGFVEINELRHSTLQTDSLLVQGKTISKKQEQDKKKWERILGNRLPLSEATKLRNDSTYSKECNMRQGGYVKNREDIFEAAQNLIDPEYYLGFLPEILAILIGMALFKWGIFSGTARRRNYFILCALGVLALGFQFYITSSTPYTQSDLVRFIDNRNIFIAFSDEFLRIFISLGYIGLIMLICFSGWMQKLKRILACTGKMAFSNYLMQSVLCTLIFNGYGLGLFAKLQRYELMFVVVVIWIFQVAFSTLWLKRFRWGPMEWLWRSLTYWKIIPNKILSSVNRKNEQIHHSARPDSVLFGYKRKELRENHEVPN